MRRRREEWRRLIAEWAASGLTADEYAELSGLKVRTLCWWKSALAREARGLAMRAPKAPSEPLNLIELGSSAAIGSAPMMELELARGRRLRFTGSVSIDTVARLVKALEVEA
jgi:hypothetical protein